MQRTRKTKTSNRLRLPNKANNRANNENNSGARRAQGQQGHRDVRGRHHGRGHQQPCAPMSSRLQPQHAPLGEATGSRHSRRRPPCTTRRRPGLGARRPQQRQAAARHACRGRAACRAAAAAAAPAGRRPHLQKGRHLACNLDQHKKIERKKKKKEKRRQTRRGNEAVVAGMAGAGRPRARQRAARPRARPAAAGSPPPFARRFTGTAILI